MPRNYVISFIVVFSLIALGFIYIRDKKIIPAFPELNFSTLFNRPASNVEVNQTGENGNTGYIISSPADFKKTTNYGDGFELTTYEKNNREGFQVVVRPFGEEGPLTHERILLDLDIDISNPKILMIGGIQAPAFNSTDETFGRTFEVWFIREGKLYQITTYSYFENQLLKILESSKFN